ncbi:MAG: ribosome assembly cofactor RimP [Micrococcus sp.]|nr:ribosome assembly cofactor RimP [Micrococcus sp.]
MHVSPDDPAADAVAEPGPAAVEQDTPSGHGPLVELVEQTLSGTGFLVEKVSVSGSSDTPTVQVLVDRIEGTEPVELDDVARLSALVSAALDSCGDSVPGVGTGEYLLEVSSAGVDRPLRTARHYARNIGRLVEVEVAGEGVQTARILAVDGQSVELAAVRPGAKKGMPAKQLAPQTHALDQLGPGRVQVEWSPAQQEKTPETSRTSQTTEA